MNESTDVASLLSLIDKEMDRLARAQEIDARAELQHHVWPLMKELVLQLDAADDDETEAWIPPEMAGHLMGAIAWLASLAESAVPAEQRAQFSQIVGSLMQEIASVTDEDEVAAYLANAAPPAQAAAPPAQPATPPAAVAAPASAPPAASSPPPPLEVNRE